MLIGQIITDAILSIFFKMHQKCETMWIFRGKFVDVGDKSMNNPSIYNVEGANRLSPGLQPQPTESVLTFLFFVRFRNCIFYSGNYFDVF